MNNAELEIFKNWYILDLRTECYKRDVFHDTADYKSQVLSYVRYKGFSKINILLSIYWSSKCENGEYKITRFEVIPELKTKESFPGEFKNEVDFLYSYVNDNFIIYNCGMLFPFLKKVSVFCSDEEKEMLKRRYEEIYGNRLP